MADQDIVNIIFSYDDILDNVVFPGTNYRKADYFMSPDYIFAVTYNPDPDTHR
jgi:hypothetical protein